MTKFARVLLVLVGVLAVVGGIVAVQVRAVTERQWKAMQSRIDDLRAAQRVRTYDRPVLLGAALPGNAWEDYTAAGRSAERRQYTYNFLEYVRGDRPKDPLSKAALAAGTFLGALEQLQRGARRARSDPYLAYDRAMNPRMSVDTGLYILPWVGMIRARVLLEEGHPGEALELWLDLLQFGRDMTDATNQRTEATALYMLDYLTLEIRRALMLNRIPVEASRTLDRGLEILDGHWPSRSRLLENHLLALGLGLTIEGQEGALIYQGGTRSRSEHSWRWMGSTRLRAAKTFEYCDAMVSKIFPTDPNAAWSGVGEWPDPLLFDTLQQLFYGGPPATISRLRLLRIGAHYTATGELLNLQDGTGLPIPATLENGVLRAFVLDPRTPDDGSNDGWWFEHKPMVIRIVRNP